MSKTMRKKISFPFWQWQKETPVAIVEENELPRWERAEDIIKVVKGKMGAKMLRYPAIRWGVHTFNNSKYLPKYPNLGKRDLFGEVLQAALKENIKVMAYCHYGIIHVSIGEKYSHWIARESDGSLARWNGKNQHYRACMCNEYFIEHMKKAIIELCKKYTFHSLYIDGPTWYGECFCEFCKKRYKEKFNEDMPNKLSFKDGSQQKYNEIRDEAIEKIIRDLKKEISKINPQLPLLFNMTLTYLPTHNTGAPERTMKWADGGNTTEIHRPDSMWNMYQSLKLGESFQKISMCYLPPGPYETLRNFSLPEFEIFSGLCLMHGATPMLGTVTTFLHDDSLKSLMKNTLKKLRRYRNIWFKTIPLSNVLLVYPKESASSVVGYNNGKFSEMFSGAFKALLHEHIQFDMIYDTCITLSKLKKYHVVVIPASGFISSELIEILYEYVKEGGNLFTSFEFSLKDKYGNDLKNFSAAELLGVDFISREPEAPYRPREYRETGPLYGYSLIPEAYLKLTLPKLKKIVGHTITPVSDAQVGIPGLQRYIKYMIVKPRKSANTQILASLFLPAKGAFGKPLEFPLGEPPGIILNRIGKGKVIYTAVSLEKYYSRRRLPETRKIISTLVSILSNDYNLIKLKAPSGVISHITFNPYTHEKYLHLLNYCGPMYEDIYGVDSIVPVRNITIGSSSCKIEKLIRISDNLEVYPQKSKEITLPELKIFDTYIIKEK